MGVVFFSGAIIISLLAMRARAPQWLLMFCGGWTLFTLLNVTWQPLMVFQLALIWGGYAFLAPQGLPQCKFWETKFWKSLPWDSVLGLVRPTPLETTTYAQPKAASTEFSDPITAKNNNRRINKVFIFQIFICILAINILIHLFPFNYSSILVGDEIARAIGSTLGIFLISLVGLFFKPNKTLAVAFIAILMTPISILIDRANDPVAPPFFRELLYPDSTANGEPLSELNAGQVDATQSDSLPPIVENPTGEAAIYDGVNKASAKIEPNIVADNWRKAAEVANQTATQAPLPEVDGYALAQMKATGSGLQTASPMDRDFVQLSTDEFRRKYGDAIGQRYSAAYALGEVQRGQSLTSQRTGRAGQ